MSHFPVLRLQGGRLLPITSTCLCPCDRLGEDFDRFREEPEKARRLFHDASGSYPLPTVPLPLDRSVERLLWGKKQTHAEGVTEVLTVSHLCHSKRYPNNPWTAPRLGPHVEHMPHQVYGAHGWLSSTSTHGEDTTVSLYCLLKNCRDCWNITLNECCLALEEDRPGVFHGQYELSEPPDRIRGGGHSEDESTCSDDRPTLQDVPSSSWHDQLVSDPACTHKSRIRSPPKYLS